MKGYAVVFEDRGQVVYRQVDIPEPGDNEVVIELSHTWISTGTESSFLRGERTSGEQPYRDGRLLRIALPRPMPPTLGR